MNSDVEIIRIDLTTETDFSAKVKALSKMYAALSVPKQLVATTTIGTTIILFYDYACKGCNHA